MAAFALADTLVKIAASFASPPQVLLFLMGGGLISFALIAIFRSDRLTDPKALYLPILLLRYLSEIMGMVSMILALTYVPLSTVGAITQAAPILVAVGAVLLLNETVSWRRWTAIAVGFIGVLMVIQPTGEDFDISISWAVLAAIGLAGRDLTTRMTPQDIPSASLATYTMFAAIPVALLWLAYDGDALIPEQTNWWIVLPMILLGSLGYLLLIAALRTTDTSVVTPFRYSRIIFLMIMGILIFDERPSFMMLAGAGLIIASGVYMMWREQRLRKQ